MRKLNIWQIAMRTWRRYGIWAFIFLALTSFFLFSVISLSSQVYIEKQAPYEIIASAASITDVTISDVKKSENIVSATPVIDVSATMQMGERNIDAPIFGIEKSYLNYPFICGSAFEEMSAMPYIVLNLNAAQVLIKKANKESITLESLADKQIILTTGEKALIAKISGVIEDNKEEPKAYISLSSAKNVILNSGTIPMYSSIYVKCVNAGKTKNVTNELNALGLEVLNTNIELEQKWSVDAINIMYLSILTGLSTLAAVIIMCGKRKNDSLISGSDNMTLRSVGLSIRQIKYLDWQRTTLFILFSFVAGIVLFLLTVNSPV